MRKINQVSDLIDLSEVRKTPYHSVEQCPDCFIYLYLMYHVCVWGGVWGSSNSGNFHSYEFISMLFAYVNLMHKMINREKITVHVINSTTITFYM